MKTVKLISYILIVLRCDIAVKKKKKKYRGAMGMVTSAERMRSPH